jgi:hypothetical protein
MDNEKLVEQGRDYRKELWIGVAVAVARSEAARSSDTPAAWANKALSAYNLTFKEEK